MLVYIHIYLFSSPLSSRSPPLHESRISTGKLTHADPDSATIDKSNAVQLPIPAFIKFVVSFQDKRRAQHGSAQKAGLGMH